MMTTTTPPEARHVPGDATLAANMTTGLLALMGRHGLTYADLAERSGVPVSTVHRIVSRGTTSHPGGFALYRIATALGTTVEDLLTGREI